ncbi:hypothetical protein HPB48_017805 [Haemaphysalis longicornis]|uniref:Uncharacterized protein n=1 Tax=Haemaphysalis longicornis TaxID=44386 RepID=A0A9J6FAD8_HAELO|nr:hypothetical protein HPB48_017805 [Haemaphysalis longicornis]
MLLATLVASQLCAQGGTTPGAEGSARARPNVGRSSKSTLAAVVRPPRQRALFVTRLAPGTTTVDLTSSLKDLLNGVEVTCTQLPSRHPSYSSFHVAIEEQHLDGINTPEAWPEGCLFRPFFGTLHGRQDVAHCLAAEAFHFIRVSGRLAPERTGEGAPQANTTLHKLTTRGTKEFWWRTVRPRMGAKSLVLWVGGTERADDCQKQPE